MILNRTLLQVVQLAAFTRLPRPRVSRAIKRRSVLVIATFPFRGNEQSIVSALHAYSCQQLGEGGAFGGGEWSLIWTPIVVQLVFVELMYYYLILIERYHLQSIFKFVIY